MTVLDSAARRLHEAGSESPRLEARLLLAHALGVSQEDVIAGNYVLDAQIRERFEAGLSRRSGREPLAYILGQREFWSLEFAVGPGVLVPRPESETLVEAALNRFPDRDCPRFGNGQRLPVAGVLIRAFARQRGWRRYLRRCARFCRRKCEKLRI